MVLTSVSTADLRPTIAGTAAFRSGRRNLKAFAIVAALPLAAMGYLAAEISFILAPQSRERPSVLVDGGTSIPQMKLRPSAGPMASADEMLPLGLSRAWQSADDPIGEFVAELGVAPTHVDYTVERGDTLSGIFGKLNISGADAQGAVAALKSAKIDNEVVIKPDQRLSLELGGAMHKRDARPLLAASLRLDPERRAEIRREVSGGFTAEIAQEDLSPRTQLARGVIDTSLFGAAGDQGVSDSIIAKFTSIYSYDVDFQRDIHPGDAFEIFYTQYANADGDVAPGRDEILFTRLRFEGKVKTFYRYTTADGKSTDYYDENGKSARTFLMRTPVDGARISSTFGMRKHPIDGYKKSHKGVDFAAPAGTRVYAAGNGKVERASRYGTYGNYVRIRHDNGYSTAYAHLKGFGKGIRAGMRVAQGQVIGYIGSTGNSTGPHLHYEVLKADRQINPMSVKVPTGVKLAGVELERFKRETQRIDIAMKSIPDAQFASADTAPTAHSKAR